MEREPRYLERGFPTTVDRGCPSVTARVEKEGIDPVSKEQPSG